MEYNSRYILQRLAITANQLMPSTEACCDRFIVLGIQYCQMETFVRAALNTDAHQPENLLQDCYFPTMPQDDLYEVKKAVLAAREEDSLENPVFKNKCKECGQEIGGESYEIKEGNIQDAGSIKPNIEEDEVPVYITEHMQEELRSISNVLGKSKEDVVLLIHYLLSEIMNKQTAARVGKWILPIQYLNMSSSR
ncbi:RNF213 [Mytilus edulis]|uniref:RNF213 n=1 Tax=Mytilus edulis TaxID=6550 RepID=A0A8S3UJG7_MYTED|nr:RNF213 [Mytilus edulis]